MPWFPVDDQFAFHRKTIAAGNAAIGLWARAGSWSSGTLTDGFVPVEMARSLGTPAQAKALVAAGLWDEVEGGYRFHAWHERNDSKADIEARRKADRERKAARRRPENGKSPGGFQPDNLPESERNPNGIQADSSRNPAGVQPARAHVPNPSLPNPSLPKKNHLGGESHESIARATEPPPPNCSKHPEGTTERCGPCGDARRAREAFDWQATKAAAVERKSRRAAIDECLFCDDNGIRHEPPSLHDRDLPAVRCDHLPMTIEAWLALIPAASHA